MNRAILAPFVLQGISQVCSQFLLPNVTEIFDAYSSIEATGEMAHKLVFAPKSNTNRLEMTEKNDTIFDSDNKSIFMRERDICLFPFFC